MIHSTHSSLICLYSGRHRPLMQRMSDMLTRWLDGNLRRTNNSNEGERTEEEAPPQDSNNEQALFDVSQDASAVEGSVEMDGGVSGWQNMPSTSGRKCKILFSRVEV